MCQRKHSICVTVATQNSDHGVKSCPRVLKMSIPSRHWWLVETSWMAQLSKSIYREKRQSYGDRRFPTGVWGTTGYDNYPGRLTSHSSSSRRWSCIAQIVFGRSGVLFVFGGRMRRVPISVLLVTQSLTGAR